MILPGLTGAISGAGRPIALTGTRVPDVRSAAPLTYGDPGDLQVVIATWGDTGNVLTPSGWTSIASDAHTTGNGDLGIAMWYRRLTGSETSTQFIDNAAHASHLNIFVLNVTSVGNVSTVENAFCDCNEGTPASGSVTMSDEGVPSVVVGVAAERVSGGSNQITATSDLGFSGATPDVTLSDLTGDHRAVVKAKLFQTGPADVTISGVSGNAVSDDVAGLGRFGLVFSG
jgi:hypothetical protein